MEKIEVGLIADLLKEVPAAAKYRMQLEALEKENAALKMEVAELRGGPADYIEKWETLDGDAVRTLQYLAQFERGHPVEIAQAYHINIQCVESYLKHLVAWNYVEAPHNGSAAPFALALKGRRYLLERGLVAAS